MTTTPTAAAIPPQALEGLKVIELGQLIAGPFAGKTLADFGADVIKIDGAIVESAARHPSRLSIVQAISDLSRNLGMRSIAEWVEDAATLRAMAEVGIDYIQGYAIARPMVPREILLGPHAAHWVADGTIRTALADIQAKRALMDKILKDYEERARQQRMYGDEDRDMEGTRDKNRKEEKESSAEEVMIFGKTLNVDSWGTPFVLAVVGGVIAIFAWCKFIVTSFQGAFPGQSHSL